jgi:hypothetical protein
MTITVCCGGQIEFGAPALEGVTLSATVLTEARMFRDGVRARIAMLYRLALLRHSVTVNRHHRTGDAGARVHTQEGRARRHLLNATNVLVGWT